MITSLHTEMSISKNYSSEYTQYLKKGIDLLTNMGEFYSKADILIKENYWVRLLTVILFFLKKNVEPLL